MSQQQNALSFEVVEEGGPQDQRPGPVSQYEPVLHAVVSARPGTWVRIQTPLDMQPHTLRTTISGPLRRRGVVHRTAIRPGDGENADVWITRTKQR